MRTGDGRPGVRAGRGEVLAARLSAGRWRAGSIGALAVLLGANSMQPLLDGGWWLPRTFLVVACITVAGGAARTLGVPAPLQPLLQFLTLLFVLVLLFVREEARWGVLPGPAALARLRELAAQGRDLAASTVPPVSVDPGLLLLVVAGVGLAALAVDTLAAGLDLPGMTLVPLASLFAVPWVIQRGSAPGWTFVVVAAGWLAVVAALQGDRVRLWGRGARAGSPGSGLAIALATIILAGLAGGLTEVRGSGAPFEVGTGSGSGTVRLDELVSLRRSLVDNDDRPVLTMAAPTDTRPDYLRLAILESFDGEQWSAIGPNATGPQPPPGGAPAVGRAPVTYRLDIGPLAGATVPSPAGAIAANNGTPVVWDQRTSLPLRGDGTSIEGSRAVLSVQRVTLTTERLRTASTVPPTPEQVFSENLADPAPLTGDELPRLAREITAGAGTPFDSAVALQQWFTTDGGFTYSTQVEGGSSGDALAVFLSDRVGYCEQFAATMALMARSLGIPARVAVGFTQGRKDGNEWVVRGTDAHAWPELWMGSAGWVRFEPTPGAPTTSTPIYSAADPQGTPSATPTESSAAPSPAASQPAGRLPDPGASDVGQASGGGSSIRWLAAVLVLLVLAVPALLRFGRRRRRFALGDGESAYREVVDTLVDLGLGEQAMTPRATVTRVSELIESSGSHDPAAAPAAPAATRILRAVEWQRYGPADSGGRRGGGGGLAKADVVGQPEHADRSSTVLVSERSSAPRGAPARAGAVTADLRVVRRALLRRAGWMRRIRAALAPRSLVGPRGGAGSRGAEGSGRSEQPAS